MPLPPDYVLYKALQFSKRLGNYLYLPLFIVCLVSFVFAVLEAYVGSAFWEYEKRFAFGLIILGLFSFVLWRLSRRPRPTLFLIEGAILGLLTILWVSWFLYALIDGKINPQWGFFGFLASLPWFLFVALGMGGAATACVHYWFELRDVPSLDLHAAFARVRSKPTGLVEALAKAPIRSVSFGATTIVVLTPEELESAPPSEIEAGRWQQEWVVVAVEQPDRRPILVDTTAKGFPVYLARPELETWHLTLIAETLQGFFDVLSKVAASHSDERPVAFENRMLPDDDADRLLGFIQRSNPKAEMWFWKKLTEAPPK